MRFTCPHCNKRGITGIGKAFSAYYSPTKCRLCGGLSAESTVPNQVSAVVHSALPLVPIYYALVLNAWWPIWSYVAATLVIQLLLVAILPLHVVDPEDAKRGYRRHTLTLIGIVTVVVAFAVLSSS